MAVLQDININVHGQPSEKRLQTFLRLSQNENGRMINFRVLGPPLPSGCTATFSGTKPDGNVYSKTGTVTGNFVVIQEDMQMTAVAGVWDAKLDIINGSHNIMTALIRVVVDADVVDPDAIASDSQLQGLVAEAKYYAEHARTDAYGSPLTAPTKAQMTDHTRVYVYTGSEPNMVAGNWYHWNGTAWISGGVYNAVAVQTDATLSVAGKAADGKATGDAIEELKEDLNADIFTLSSECIQAVEIESGYYNTTNGKKYDSDEWVRSTTLIPFVSTKDTAVYSTCGYTVNIACYDKNKNILDSTYYAQAYVVGDRSTPKPIPKGTFYLGLNIHNSGATKISIAELPSADVVEYPFTPFYLIANCWATQNGNVSITESYDCVLIPVTAGDVWYTNSTVAANFICFDKTGTFLGMASATSINNHGNLYTIPDDAVYAYVNIQHNKTHGNYSTVYHKMTKGVKILCIGDSITWLDGQTSTSYDNASLFLGYQKQLTAKGYEVTSAGYSGYIYAVDGEHSSIYTKIVTDEYDVSGYDYIVLAGGTNDDLYAVPVGSIPSAYSGVTHDISTTLGALAGLIDYIRANNPTCKIILCTQLKSESPNRPYTEAVQYADGIRNIAKFESCYLVDLFENMNIQPFTDGFDLYFYDTTHPRKAGMQRMGALIAQAVENA